jgi:hypothetical protein
MGCVSNKKYVKINTQIHSDKIILETNISNPYFFANLKNISIMTFNNFLDFQNIINIKNWKKILDYLSYQDLKEVGKVNKKLNSLVKSNEILLKFFKNKEEDISNYKQSFDSFSQLKISNYYSFCTNISINYN